MEGDAARAADRQPVAIGREIPRVTFEAAVRAVRLHEVFEVGRDGHVTRSTIAWASAEPVHRQDCRTRPLQPSSKIECRLGPQSFETLDNVRLAGQGRVVNHPRSRVSASAFSSQYAMPISRYIVVAVARCSWACSRLSMRR